ncbi:mitochondrial ornithine transporter 1 [Daphnia magna]|uniref:Mitochondrial ornithine transporter 1 n=2 Tax=Daphnia magna TaxID=35525 RepID=A0A0P5KHR5_9CRUS|nr:mitochondrial ornithine transporter 1 [Daphnia magna]KAK4016332.1 hypothetical protein OUZ56_031283 [Daphnia magna]KZS04188.1 Mitochondrial ornithine transporter 1 [Daphnia magna]
MESSSSAKLQNSNERSKFREATVDLIAGSLGGAANVFVGQSLDTVKVKMQTFPTLYNNMFSCFKTTFAKDGIRGLYAGTIPALAANIAENSVLFAGYGVCQKAVAWAIDIPKVQDLSPLANASAGFFAAFFSSLTLCPTELVKCRLQAHQETQGLGNGKSKVRSVGPWVITREIIKNEGLKGMFRGLVPTFAREMPGYFCFFGGYELCRHLLTPPGKTKDEIGAIRTIICGGVGGISLWVAIFPFDVIKSRVQVSQAASQPMMKMLFHIARTEGVMALYNGLGPTVIRTFPGTGALFLAYETSRKFMNEFCDKF